MKTYSESVAGAVRDWQASTGASYRVLSAILRMDIGSMSRRMNGVTDWRAAELQTLYQLGVAIPPFSGSYRR